MDTTDRPASLRFGFGLEKWYADAFLDDGSLLIVTIGRLRLLGIVFDRLSADLHGADGSRISTARALGRGRREPGGISFRRAGATRETVHWESPGLSGSLRFGPAGEAFTPADPVLRRGRRTLRWIVTAPDVPVVGDLVTSSGRRTIRGRGYRDYVSLDLPPWALRGAELRWGRSIAGPAAKTWFRLMTGHAVVECTWTDGVMRREFQPPVLGRERVLTEALLTDLPIMRIGPVRRLLGTLGGWPRQLRARADEVDGSPGRAVHELVTWESG